MAKKIIKYELTTEHGRAITEAGKRTARRDNRRGEDTKNPYRRNTNKAELWAVGYVAVRET